MNMPNDRLLTNLLQNLECPICLDVMDHAKELQCGHVFCKCCLDDLVQFKENGGLRFTCPVCKSKTNLPRFQTTSNLKESILINKLLSTYNDQKR